VSEVLAGVVCGYALAVVSAPLVALALLRLRPQVSFLAVAVPGNMPVVALAVPLFWFTFLLCTALGMVFGLALLGFEDRAPEGGLGSPNLAFTLFAVFWSVVAFAPVAIPLKSARRYVFVAAVAFAGVFGWLMPHLAGWGPLASS
jgi:hypothetical protein